MPLSFALHLCFNPITEDGRLSAKDIVGNRTHLTWWQDSFFEHNEKIEIFAWRLLPEIKQFFAYEDIRKSLTNGNGNSKINS